MNHTRLIAILLSACLFGPLSASESSSSDCSLCADLSAVEGDFRECCNDIRKELTEILQDLENQFPCDALFAIDHVPFPITASGKYCVTTDLVYSGTGAAITVSADDVTINFYNHSLTLDDLDADGILVQNVDEFVLENDLIQGASLFTTGTGSAVHLVNVNKATLENIYTKNTNRGLLVEDSTDVFVKNSFFQFHEGTSPNMGAGIWVDSSQGVTADLCTFEGTNSATPFSSGLYVQGPSENITLTASSFTNWQFSINLNQVTGVLIDNCLAVGQSTIPSSLSTPTGIILIGSENQANDLIIRNSALSQSTKIFKFVGINFVNGSGALLENIVSDITANGTSNISLSGYSDVFATGCVVRGDSLDSLSISAPSTNVTFTNSHFTATGNTISFESCTSCTIKNSTISASANGNGVNINGGLDNAIIDCIIASNDRAGIFIGPGATNSHISGNRIFGNGQIGIFNDSTTAEFYFNTVCNNCTTIVGGCSNTGTPDCSDVIPHQLPSDTAVVGSNICCTQMTP